MNIITADSVNSLQMSRVPQLCSLRCPRCRRGAGARAAAAAGAPEAAPGAGPQQRKASDTPPGEALASLLLRWGTAAFLLREVMPVNVCLLPDTRSSPESQPPLLAAFLPAHRRGRPRGALWLGGSLPTQHSTVTVGACAHRAP